MSKCWIVLQLSAKVRRSSSVTLQLLSVRDFNSLQLFSNVLKPCEVIWLHLESEIDSNRGKFVAMETIAASSVFAQPSNSNVVRFVDAVANAKLVSEPQFERSRCCSCVAAVNS